MVREMTMSLEELSRFGRKALEDPSLRERLEAIPGENEESRLTEIVRLAEAEGFDVTADELQTVARAMDRSLSPDELDAVVGGLSGLSATSSTLRRDPGLAVVGSLITRLG